MKKEQIACETQDGNISWADTDNIQLRTSAYGILADNSGRLLVIQAHLPLWESPENGETISQAVEREFEEETGIKIRPKELILLRESFYQTPGKQVYHSLQHFFIVEKIGGNINFSKDNLTQATWNETLDLSQDNMNRGAFEALKAYLEYPQGKFRFLNPAQNG